MQDAARELDFERAGEGFAIYVYEYADFMAIVAEELGIDSEPLHRLKISPGPGALRLAMRLLSRILSKAFAALRREKNATTAAPPDLASSVLAIVEAGQKAIRDAWLIPEVRQAALQAAVAEARTHPLAPASGQAGADRARQVDDEPPAEAASGDTRGDTRKKTQKKRSSPGRRLWNKECQEVLGLYRCSLRGDPATSMNGIVNTYGLEKGWSA
ncbi:MAG TPA: hypothetical protein VMR25_26890, partial [Planctomycetaceae bacterium]|nr:hypothetical protein [Planctomycetaceae bacterium]